MLAANRTDWTVVVKQRQQTYEDKLAALRINDSYLFPSGILYRCIRFYSSCSSSRLKVNARLCSVTVRKRYDTQGFNFLSP